MARALVAAAALVLLSGASATSARPLSARERAELPRLEAALAAQPSATKALEGWCKARHFADPATITAVAVVAPGDPSASATPPAVRRALGVGPDEPLAFRHVELRCGKAVLSEAQNWYVRSRLSDAMNTALDSTSIPFGTVAAPLHFVRAPLASQRGRAPDCPAGTILSHRARLNLPDGQGLALVAECYLRDNLRPPGLVLRGPRPIDPLPTHLSLSQRGAP